MTQTPYHPDLNDCPLQCKIIADAIQGYALADPGDRDDLFDPVFLDWGFGPYWAIAKQLIKAPLCDQFADILNLTNDKKARAHRIVYFFWNGGPSIDADSLKVAEMVTY
ncbi:hypothetical protein BZK31_26840 [Pseudomonas floridensis]|uniref:Uncharacterized protein n=1 Tax=Pseudomonas floridensis TaxID=1958950 RepID=A0A1X0MYV6_9PSED|nr:hypothetical protein [Pseudomonas floridensis]ORC53921.1 hypothetical protein BZK31_26840 [Pseudomonas floridensis]